MLDEMKQIKDNILKEEDDITLKISLNDLIWSIIVYSYNMRNIEDELFSHYPYCPPNLTKIDMEQLSKDKEYLACRRDELTRLISQYSDFDTSRIWEQVDTIFKDYSKGE